MVIATKTYISERTSGQCGMTLEMTDLLGCSKNEEYKTTPLFQGDYRTVFRNDNDDYCSLQSLDIQLVPANTGRCALYFLSGTSTNSIVNQGEGTVNFNWYEYEHYSGITPRERYVQNQGSFPSIDSNLTSGTAYFATNVPVFPTEALARSYIYAESDIDALRILEANCMNYVDSEYHEDETNYYVITTENTTVDILRGNVQEADQATRTYRSSMFQANTIPALYFNEDFSLTLIAPNVVAGYSLPSPLSVLQNVPESYWNEGSIGYNGLYYSNIGYKSTYPGDGSYTYGIYFYTNIPVFQNQSEAENAISTGDYDGAINYQNIIDGNYGRVPDFGTEETSTSFGDGTWSSPFVSQYVMSSAQVRDVCSIFFDDDQGLIDDIKKGLELFGAKPVDAIMSLVAFPFDVTTIANCSTQNYIYFGSYQHTLQNPVYKIYNQLSNYLDAGTIYLAPIFGNWRDYKQLTLSVFLPYIGWRDLEIEKYIKKNINIRYYVDLNTRQCAAVLVANGIMSDYYVGEIGVELPIVGSNFSDYARSEIQHLSNTAKGMLNPVSPEAISNILGANSYAGKLAFTENWGNYGQYKFGQNGSPKDMQMTKGSFSSGVGNYLPNYVMFRYDIHDIEEPAMLNELCGKPSTASGKISQFSGFLSGRVSKLVTTGMTDSEIQEVQNAIMNDGIYI